MRGKLVVAKRPSFSSKMAYSAAKLPGSKLTQVSTCSALVSAKHRSLLGAKAGASRVVRKDGSPAR